VEQLYSKVCVIANLCPLEMGALAAAKVTTEGSKRGEIDVRQTTASALNEAAEMNGCANISNRACGSVSVVFELIRK
jgi:hypothetical protein